MARFQNPYTPRTEIGVGLQNLMGALYAQKLQAADGETAAKRSAAQDLRDRAEADKATAEANQIRRQEGGVGGYVPNFARSLVPGKDVPNVMNRLETGDWLAQDDPDLAGPLRPDDSPLQSMRPPQGWKPEYDDQLRDAQQVAAGLFASKPADFKDVNAAQQGPASRRRMADLIAQAMGLQNNQPTAVAPARAAVPQLGLPSGPGMMPTQVQDENGVVTKPYDIAGLPPLPGGAPVAPAAEQVMPTVETTAPAISNWDRLIEAAPLMAAEDPTFANSVVGAAGERRQRDENARKAGKTRTSLGTSGLEYDDKLNKFFIAGSDTPATAEQLTAFEKSGKSPGVVVNAFEKQRDKDTGTDVVRRRKEAMRAIDFANAGRAAAQALEGYSGGPFAQWQAKLGNVLPESEWGKIASVEEFAKGLRGKMAPELRAEGSGATSDLEFGEFMNAFPTLAQTPQGRALISQGFEKYAERVAAAADIYAELTDSGKFSLTAYRKAIKERLGDNLFTREEMAAIRSGGERRAGPVHQSRPAPASNDAQRLRQLEEEARRKGLVIPP